MDKVLEDIYYNLDSPSSFTGINSLYKEAKKQLPNISVSDVKRWLCKQESHTLHKPRRKKFLHRRVYVSGIDEQFQIDLCDMRAVAKENDGNNYILTCIDVFSKFAWAVPTKTKRPSEVAQAFVHVLLDGRKPKFVQSDEGTEFLGHPFQTMLKNENILFFTSKNPDIKCSVVERFNRTLKTRMWKVFTKLRSHRWVDILPKLVKAYNNSFHRSIHMRPVDVTKSNESEVWHILYGGNDEESKQTFKFNVGDQVRVGVKPNPFRKGYEPQWTEEIFTVSTRLARKPPMYFVKDANGEEIRGSYYEHELQKVVKDVKAPYWVEKVLESRRNKRGQLEHFVKWSGYPANFNQWIPASDLNV